MATYNFYTLTWKGKQYRVLTEHRISAARERLADLLKTSAAEVLLVRGADSRLPFWNTCSDIVEALGLQLIDRKEP